MLTLWQLGYLWPHPAPRWQWTRDMFGEAYHDFWAGWSEHYLVTYKAYAKSELAQLFE